MQFTLGCLLSCCILLLVGNYLVTQPNNKKEATISFPQQFFYTGCTVLILYAWQVGSQVLTVEVLSYTLKSVQLVLPYTCMSLSEHLDSSSRSCGQGPFGRQQNLHNQNQRCLRAFCFLCPCQLSLSVADHIPLVLIQSFQIRNPSSARCKAATSHTKSPILSPNAMTNLPIRNCGGY